jgi:hypothetical protein
MRIVAPAFTPGEFVGCQSLALAVLALEVIAIGLKRIVDRARNGRWRIALAANHSFKLSFTVRSGTTRVRHRKMAEFPLAWSGTDANPQVKPMDRWAEPLISQAYLAAVCRSMPSALAALRLMTSSNFTGAWTGRSAGLLPLRIRSTYEAARRCISA